MYNTEYDMKYIVFASGQQTTNPLPRSPRVLREFYSPPSLKSGMRLLGEGRSLLKLFKCTLNDAVFR